MGAAKILAVDDEADFELLITQRFRRQIREREFAFCFAHQARRRSPRSRPSRISS
jgi:adenylate cyclase